MLRSRGPRTRQPPPEGVNVDYAPYDKIQYGYDGPKNDGCDGNGSTTGMQSQTQSLSQRLLTARQNTRHVTASEATGILEEIHMLKQKAKIASTDRNMEIALTSPLREAARLIERAYLPGLPDQEGSVSATTPTHLTQLFIRRVNLHTPELGKSQAQYLTAQAYCLIAALEGQNQPGKSCRISGLGRTR